MTPDFVKEAVKHPGTVYAAYKGNTYQITDIVKMKTPDGWVEAAIYWCVQPFGHYCRALDDFGGFEYKCNHTICHP